MELCAFPGNRRCCICLFLVICAFCLFGQFALRYYPLFDYIGHYLKYNTSHYRQREDVGHVGSTRSGNLTAVTVMVVEDNNGTVTRPQPTRPAINSFDNTTQLFDNTTYRQRQHYDVGKARGDTGVGLKVMKLRPTRPAVNSFISPYHKHWNVNCSAIFTGNNAEVTKTKGMLKELRDEDDNLQMPSDNEVQQWVTNCSDYRVNRHYPDVALSDEEDDYPLAYIKVTHKESAQVERLLRAIYQPQNVYCLHPDGKSPDSFQTAIRKLASCFDNVFIVSEIENVQYYGFTRLKADINCMQDLNKHHVKWKYVMNLCGQDFPMKTNLEIVRQLKAYNGHNDINGIIPPPHIVVRTKYHFDMSNKIPVHTGILKSLPPPHNLTVYFGNAYIAATWEFVDFVVNDKVAIDLLEWSNDTWSPDEHYWVTLQRSVYAPGGFPNGTWESLIRFIKWGDDPKIPSCQGKYVRAVCIFDVGYLEYLHLQPHLFANKFYYSYDPVAIQCMEEMLDDRTRHPGMSGKLANFPVKDMSWQNYTIPTDPSQSEDYKLKSPE